MPAVLTTKTVREDHHSGSASARMRHTVARGEHVVTLDMDGTEEWRFASVEEARVLWRELRALLEARGYRRDR